MCIQDIYIITSLWFCSFQKYPVYAAIATYAPSESEKDALPVQEGKLVDVLDSSSPDRWLCRLPDRPSHVGWVPPSYLVPQKQDEKLDKRSTREVFRDDVIKIDNERSEAVMKRRCYVTHRIAC